MCALPLRALGNSAIDVSVMSLGSWRTYERIPRQQALAVMHAAQQAGITFLDDARYNDETGTAPIPTGYSEVVFGELFRAAGWVRDEVVVANKLWWEFWPEQSAADELDQSLSRMKLDHVDLIYAVHPPDTLPIDVVVEQVAELITSGRARAWGAAMWTADQLGQALDVCDATGTPPPCAAQMATSLVDHESATDPAMLPNFVRGPVGLVASYVLAGGTLTGKYARNERGRATDDDTPVVVRGKQLAANVEALAQAWDVPAAHVAFAYAFMHPHLASVVFGASTAEQLAQNVGAWTTFEQLDGDQRAAVLKLAE